MKYLVTAQEMKEYDENTIEKIGIPGMVLMERAALAALSRIQDYLGQHRDRGNTVLILAGMGNNGGDGLALARLLAEENYKVEVWCVGDRKKASSQWLLQEAVLQNYPVRISSKAEQKEYTVIVDALFGVGLTREVAGMYAESIALLNRLEGYKLALDIPSGICADTGRILGCAVRADATVTFGFCKRGLVLGRGAEYAGRVITASIGITPRSFFGREPGMFYYDENILELLPKRARLGNKGTFGKALLVAGSVNMAGAAILAAKACYRAGAGMVKVITPEENRQILQTALPEALLGTMSELRSSLEWADVVAVGPGLGKGHEAKSCLQEILREGKHPLVIDADGLNLIAGDTQLRELLRTTTAANPAVILTPHVGELARLMELSIPQLKNKLPTYAGRLAEELGITLVAKDAVTLVTGRKGPACVNIRGNSGMATAGSGDVLTGIIAALLGAGMGAFDAASVGVCLHAMAGDLAAAAKGEYGCMAGDIAEATAEVIALETTAAHRRGRYQCQISQI